MFSNQLRINVEKEIPLHLSHKERAVVNNHNTWFDSSFATVKHGAGSRGSGTYGTNTTYRDEGQAPTGGNVGGWRISAVSRHQRELAILVNIELANSLFIRKNFLLPWNSSVSAIRETERWAPPAQISEGLVPQSSHINGGDWKGSFNMETMETTITQSLWSQSHIFPFKY